MNDQSDELKKAQDRIKQLEETFQMYSWALPPKPDASLAEDEWYAVFSDWQNLTTETLSNIPWQGGANSTPTFIVKKHDRLRADKNLAINNLLESNKRLVFLIEKATEIIVSAGNPYALKWEHVRQDAKEQK